MRKIKLLGTTVLQSAVFTSALVMAAPAFAQEVASEQDNPATLTSEQEIKSGEDADCTANPTLASCKTIVVTGSRIRRPNLELAPARDIGRR